MTIKRIQLGLLHVAVAMTLVPINSTLNRVMIKELALSAALVALLASLPYLFSPIQVAIGSFSDRHPLLGFRRSPYILIGLLLCVSGVALAPLAAFQLDLNPLTGLGLSVLAFGAWGMGFNFASVSYLSLATELSGERGRGRTIAVMFFMMITSIIFTAIALGHLVEPYSPQALVRAFWIVSLAALLLGLLGLWRLEPRSRLAGPGAREYSWPEMFRFILNNRQARRFFWYLTILLAAILGQDILLEPFGGEAFGLSVQQTTRITSIWGACVLATLVVAGVLEGRIARRKIVVTGGALALVGFLVIVASGLWPNRAVFYAGVILLGSGTGLSTVSNLSLMLDMTTAEKVGLFMGAWGMSNALSRLAGSLLAGVVRDIFTHLTGNLVAGYLVVFLIEAGLALASLYILRGIDVSAFRRQADEPGLMERAALAE